MGAQKRNHHTRAANHHEMYIKLNAQISPKKLREVKSTAQRAQSIRLITAARPERREPRGAHAWRVRVGNVISLRHLRRGASRPPAAAFVTPLFGCVFSQPRPHAGPWGTSSAVILPGSRSSSGHQVPQRQ